MTSHTEPMYMFDGWLFKLGRRLLFNPQGVEVSLTSSEFDLVRVFCENPQRALTREFLAAALTAVWPPDTTISPAFAPRHIDVSIARLRQKIEATPKKPLLIKTVRKVGYWFAPPAKLV